MSGRVVRDVSGAILIVVALAALVHGVLTLRAHDYLAAILVLASGLAIMRGAVELLRPTVGE